MSISHNDTRLAFEFALYAPACELIDFLFGISSNPQPILPNPIIPQLNFIAPILN